jgi:Flp pilus assembly protein TadD
MSKDLALAAALGLLVAAVYLPSLANGFLYDDHEVIEVQPRPAGIGEIARVFAEPHFRGLPYYRPLVRASLLAQKGLHGDAPALFHLGNALLAGATAVAAFALLRAPRLGVDALPAFLASLLFAVHPVASSAVLPIASGRETLMPALWMLAAMAAWLRARSGIALACFAAALASKEQAAVLPLLFVAADLLGLGPGAPPLRLRCARDWIARYAGVVAIALAYVAVRRAVLGSTAVEWAIAGDPIAPLRSLLFGAQVALAPFAALHYEPELGGWYSPRRSAIAVAVLGALLAFARRTGAPSVRVAAFWLAWFVVTQLPTANVFRQEAPYDERYAFLASLAFPAVAAASATAFATSLRRRRAVIAAAAMAIASLAALTIRRAATFRDDASFAAQWLRTNPASSEAHHLLAVIAMQQGQLDEAVSQYRDALAGASGSPDLHVNLAVALAESGRGAEAETELRLALALDPGHPEAHATLGALLARSGRLEEAVAEQRAAIRAAPRMASAHDNLGSALARLGRWDEAERALREAVRLAPQDPDAAHNLALVLRATGRGEEADALLRGVDRGVAPRSER